MIPKVSIRSNQRKKNLLGEKKESVKKKESVEENMNMLGKIIC